MCPIHEIHRSLLVTLIITKTNTYSSHRIIIKGLKIYNTKSTTYKLCKTKSADKFGIYNGTKICGGPSQLYKLSFIIPQKLHLHIH